MTDELFALLFFCIAPAIPFCLQYGWDLLMDDIVPYTEEED